MKQKSSSFSNLAISASVLSCCLSFEFGATNAKIKSTGCPSLAPKSIGFSSVINYPVILVHAAILQWGMATPLPKLVTPRRSLSTKLQKTVSASRLLLSVAIMLLIVLNNLVLLVTLILL